MDNGRSSTVLALMVTGGLHMATITAKREVIEVPADRVLISIDLSGDVQIVSAAQERLRATSIYELTQIRCALHEGTLFLCGTVSSFYHKQLAQEAVKALAGVTRIVNQLDVVARIASIEMDRDIEVLLPMPSLVRAKRAK